MNEPRSLIVVASLDDRDQAVLEVGCWLAGAFALKSITLLHLQPAWEIPPYWPPTASEEPLGRDDREVEARLAALEENMRPCLSRDTAIEAVVRRGSAVAELIRLERECSADLVILGQTQRPTYDHLSESLPAIVRKVPCSVLSVPEGTRTPLRRFLVPVDFSELSRDTLKVAQRLAQLDPTTTITAQHVYSVPLGYHKLGQTHEEAAAAMRQLAQEHWRKWSESLGPEAAKITMRLDLSDETAAAVLAAAQEIDAQLILLGGHGRTLPSGVLLGHTADVVCRHSNRPVLCIKKKGQVVHLVEALLQLFTQD